MALTLPDSCFLSSLNTVHNTELRAGRRETYLNSESGSGEGTEAAIRVLLAREPGHGAAHEVDEAAVAVVLHHAAQRQDHHRYCVWVVI